MKMRSKFSSLLLISAAVVTAQSASAADLPARPAYKAPVQIVSWDWTGPYLGVYAGIAASRSRSFDPTGAVAGVIEHTGYGLSAGGTLGYNWQTSWNMMGGAVVVGLEGDIGYFNAGGAPRIGTPPAPTITTRRGRAPPAAAPVSRSARTSPTSPAATPRSTSTTGSHAAGVTVSTSKLRSGYALGSGLETMLGGGWTAKSEYMFTSFGDGDTLVNGGARCRPRSSAITASASA